MDKKWLHDNFLKKIFLYEIYSENPQCTNTSGHLITVYLCLKLPIKEDLKLMGPVEV